MKSQKMIIKVKTSIGHYPPAFRCGKWQDKRQKRQRTRQAQYRHAIRQGETNGY